MGFTITGNETLLFITTDASKFEFDNEKILLITLMRHFDSTLMQQDS